MNKKLANFIQLLQAPLPFEEVFNPWHDIDQEHGLDKKGPKIRTDQLAHYLKSRLDHADLVLIGEALGYQGGHFTGIAMTSERILLGHQEERGILPHHVLPDLKPKRTSKPAIKPNGFTEPTATIVWHKLMRLCDTSLQFVLWNAFAWHPFQEAEGLLSNRKPRKVELTHSMKTLRNFLGLFPGSKVIGVGNVAAEQLSSLKVQFHQVRHPAQGGAAKFREQISDLYNRMYHAERTTQSSSN